MQKRFLPIISGLVVVISLLFSARHVDATGDTSKVVTIAIHNFTFEPATATVHVGDTVEWKNEDNVSHTATVDAAKPVFDSGAIQTGAAWRYVAREKGTYNYICTIHPYMKGKLIVQ